MGPSDFWAGGTARWVPGKAKVGGAGAPKRTSISEESAGPRLAVDGGPLTREEVERMMNVGEGFGVERRFRG